MGKNFKLGDEDLPEDFGKQLTLVIDLPYYETLRTILEPYMPAGDEHTADKTFTSSEIIKAIEEHHGVPQGPQKGEAKDWVQPEDFTRAMVYCGYKAINTGGLQLEWLLRQK